MSEVIYLIGAGASYGQRGKDNKGEIIPGNIERGLPIVNQLADSIDWYCSKLRPQYAIGGVSSAPKLKYLYDELTWLRDKCKEYPTIDTYAKQLSVTDHALDLNRLKKALSLFFTLIQSHNQRDLRYDGFIASIIQDNCVLPDNISILSWNYDYQLEYVLQDFNLVRTDIPHLWQHRGVTCKGFRNFINNEHFNFIKLNGTAMFSTSAGHELIDPSFCTPEKFDELLRKDDGLWSSNISFAWEKDDELVNNILPILKDTKVLVVIGYSFPYVNRSVDRKLIQAMDSLNSVYIQDTNANDVKQSFETLLTENQRQGTRQNLIKIHLKTSVSQFIIPNELT